MMAAEKWRILPRGLQHAFSPSGHALAFKAVMSARTHTLEVQFLDDRPPVTLDEPNIYTIAWASDTEIVYSAFKPPLNTSSEAYLRVLSLENQEARLLGEVNEAFTAAWSGQPGHLSILSQWD